MTRPKESLLVNVGAVILYFFHKIIVLANSNQAVDDPSVLSVRLPRETLLRISSTDLSQYAHQLKALLLSLCTLIYH